MEKYNNHNPFVNRLDVKISLWVSVSWENIHQLQPLFDTPLKLTSKVFLEDVIADVLFDVCSIDGTFYGVLGKYILILTQQGSIEVPLDGMIFKDQVLEQLCSAFERIADIQKNVA